MPWMLHHGHVSTAVKWAKESDGFPLANALPEFHLMTLGKILVDENPVSQYNITEKDFLVVMVAKVRTTLRHLCVALKERRESSCVE